MRLGTIIRKYREKQPRFKTKTAFAREIGVSVEHVRRLENGMSLPSGELMEKIVDALELPEGKRTHMWLTLAYKQLDEATKKNVASIRRQNYRTYAEAAIKVFSQYYEVLEDDIPLFVEQMVTQMENDE